MQSAVESLLAQERPDRARDLGCRERRIETALAALVAVGAVLWIALGGAAPSLPSLAVGVLVVAVTSGVRLHAGGGSATGATLGVVPLFWLLPLSWVPAVVATAFVLAATPGALAARHPTWRVLTAAGDAAYVFAPTLVLAALGDGDPDPWMLIPALAAQFATDAGLSVAREWLGRGIRPELQLRVMAVVFGVDAALAPVGVALAQEAVLALAAIPLCLLLGAMGRERNARLTDAANRLAALEGERERVDLALHRTGRSLAAGLEGLDVLELAVGTAVDALAADAGRARLAGEHDATVFGARAGQACVAHTTALLAAERSALAGTDEAVAESGGWHALAVPVRHDASAAGAVSVCRADEPFNPRERRLLAYLAAQAGAALGRSELQERAAARHRVDPLLGLPDRRTLRDELHLAVERADRTCSRLSALMLDVDALRDVNAALGEDAGDEALRAVADFVAERCRLTDVAARYEEDTLVLILPGTSIAGAHMVAEDLRTGIGRLDVKAGPGTIRLTVSVGIAERSAASASPEALLDAARRALLEAKATGRNRSVSASDQTFG